MDSLEPSLRQELIGGSHRQLCVCSEWCQFDSLYFHNPVARFVVCQNQRLFAVPDDLIVSFHLLAVCRLLTSVDCRSLSLLSATVRDLHHYLEHKLDSKTDRLHFWNTRAAELILESYFRLKSWLKKEAPLIFGPEAETKTVDTASSHELQFLVRAMLWLAKTIRFSLKKTNRAEDKQVLDKDIETLNRILS